MYSFIYRFFISEVDDDNIKEVFHARCKIYSNWKKTEDLLKNKYDYKAKLEATNKLDKIPTAAAEIRDVTILNFTSF